MNVIRYFGIGTVAILSFLAFLTTTVSACSCMPSHPQKHFCEADYVIIMRVLRKSHRLVKGHLTFKVEIKKSYKISDQAQNNLKHGRITTANSDLACGVNLEIGKLYVVAGKGTKLSMCDYIKEYQKMSIIERRGFAGNYYKGCACEIKTCFSRCLIQQNGLSCNWSPFAKCETNFSSCVPTVYRTPEGPISRCYWKRTPPYKACLSDP